ncbi:MAG: Dabb family protein [Acidobacteria bacterium]|nr:Dabb family protein [Acidobacteriota bacterium]
MKRLLFTLFAAAALTVAPIHAAAKKPASVMHVITIKWKEGTTPEQIAGALKGAETVANTYKGITRIWTRAIKVQGAGYTHAIVMEFRDEKALKDYTDSPAQKEWYKIYLPLRGESTTHDITN